MAQFFDQTVVDELAFDEIAFDEIAFDEIAFDEIAFDEKTLFGQKPNSTFFPQTLKSISLKNY
jgi:hypothetical protein